MNMFEQIVASGNIKRAYDFLSHRYYDAELRRYLFRPGPDGETFEQFNGNLQKKLDEIQQRLRHKDFTFGAYFERAIPKGEGKLRPIGRFNLRDKIAQRSMYQVVVQALDDIFSDSLISYRKGQGAWDAALRAIRLVRAEKGQVWVFRTDVRNYFDAMDHEIARELLHNLMANEPEVPRLFFAFLAQPRIAGGPPQPRDVGVPQGSELSMWLSNLYLNDLDYRMVDSGFRYSRYSDDVIVWGRSEDEAVKARLVVTHFLKKMKLELSPRKTLIAAPGEPYDYLGYSFQGLTLTISRKSLGHLTGWIRRRLRKRLYKRLKEQDLGRVDFLKRIIADFQNPTNTQRLITWIRYFQRITDA
jgi:retron-type reverse transcriptase